MEDIKIINDKVAAKHGLTFEEYGHLLDVYKEDRLHISQSFLLL